MLFSRCLLPVFLACLADVCLAVESPHIVLFLVDDMGYGDPGCFNPESKISTPHIDRLASEGMRFTDAHAPGPLCHMSRYGLITGRYPFRTDVEHWRARPLIEADRMTIASLLRSRGYRTAMDGKWQRGFQEHGYDKPLHGGPIDRGFDSFFGIRASTDIPPYFYILDDRATEPPTAHIEANNSEGWSPIQGAFWRAGGIAPKLKLKDVLPRFTEEAIGVIKSHATSQKNKPLMLYVALPAPHTPWLPSTEFASRSKVGMYGDFVMMVDAMVGRLLGALDDAGMTDETLLIFTSDNGPVWFDGDVERFHHDAAGGLRGMKGDAWEAGHRMPFIVRWPGKVQPNSVSRQTISFTDLMATLGAIVGVDLPEGAGPDSFNFLPVLVGKHPEKTPIRGPLVVPSANGTLTIRSGRWKLISALGSGGFSEPRRIEATPGGPEGQLYDLEQDLGETTNLYAQQPEVVQRLKRELKEIRNPLKSRR